MNEKLLVKITKVYYKGVFRFQKDIFRKRYWVTLIKPE